MMQHIATLREEVAAVTSLAGISHKIVDAVLKYLNRASFHHSSTGLIVEHKILSYNCSH